MANEAAYGLKWPASLAKFDPATSSWKTAQFSLLGDLDEFSQTWPRWGLMRNGECWERPTLAPRTSASVSGLWATPAASDSSRGGTITDNMTGQSLVQMVNTPKYWPTPLASDGAKGGPNQRGAKGDLRLPSAVVQWPTPQARDYRSGDAPDSQRAQRKMAAGWSPNLNDVVLWPTPTVCGNNNRKGVTAKSGDGLATAAKQRTYPTATATMHKGWSPNHNRADSDDRLDYTIEREAFDPGQKTPPMRLNPEWVEWLMGWPIGHTGLKPLETGRYHEWLQQHGSC